MEILLLYADDIILVASSSQLSSTIIEFLQKVYPMKDLGNLHYSIGIEATFLDDSQKLLLTQNKYTIDMLHCKPPKTPVLHGPRLSLSTGVPLTDVTGYRSVVGGLQYLTMTTPNICFAVTYVSQFMHATTSEHLLLVKRIFRYLKGTIDWAGCPDTRRSTSGFCTFLGSSIISWSSKKQPTISRSSAEVEYKSMVVVAAEVVWISFLLHELEQVDDVFTKGLTHPMFLSLVIKLLCFQQYKLEGDCENE
ncbi:uncharacterized protein LOC113311911 [Papaver somniferum]|uniref:uncharacterized protein LOC113311911 n=1 Tax=Papaver somniferum TaxID=3469 RepID=UPI000E6FA71F|nr:uncharacterized protein LOC113311911 [Papaver somniferum]